MRATKTPSVPALVRGLAILERISKSRRGLTFAQLTRHFDFPKSSVHTLLLTFEREGYLRRDSDTGRYMTGTKLADIACPSPKAAREPLDRSASSAANGPRIRPKRVTATGTPDRRTRSGDAAGAAQWQTPTSRLLTSAE